MYIPKINYNFFITRGEGITSTAEDRNECCLVFSENGNKEWSGGLLVDLIHALNVVYVQIRSS